MSSVITKLTEMVIMILIGYISAKFHITGPEFNRHTSAVLTNVLLPATILKAIIGLNSSVSNGELIFVILLYFLMMGIAWAVGKLAAIVLPLKQDDRGIMLCVIMYMNLAFVGFPLVESFYGPEGMFYACLSSVPMNLLMFSAGVVAISGVKSDGYNLKKLFNLPLVATAIGICILVFKVPVPRVAFSCIESIAAATVPMSMIVLGSSLAATSIISAFGDWRVYVASFGRLIVCPIITNLLLRLFLDNEILIGTVTILASTPVAVLVTPLCVQYGKDDRLSSKSIFISTVLSVLTMPLIMWAFL